MMTARFGTDEFRDLIEEVGAAVDDRRNVCVVLLGGDNQARQSALSALADYTSLDVYQRDAAALIGERPLQSQGNLREAFDQASDAPTILVFNDADALFEAARREAEEHDLDEDARTLVDYLFDRIGSKPGVTVLHLCYPEHLGRAKEVADAVIKL